MRRVALTGNIGSGKSTVARLFTYFGLPVYDADAEGHKAYGDEGVKSRVRELLGPGVFDAQGRIDRAALAGMAFADDDMLRSLSAIIHPWVLRSFDNWAAGLKGEHGMVVMESAIIFEYGLQELFDGVVVVTAPQPLRVSRISRRDGVTSEQAIQRMQRQWPEERKAAMADHVLVNDGESMLLPQVIDLLKVWGIKP